MTTLADYEAWKQKQQTAGVSAASVVLGSVEEQPDEVAGDLKLASEFGKVTGSPTPPRPLVAEYRNVFQQAIEQRKSETILAKSPRLTDWLRDPENAAVSRDDLPGLSWFENFGRGKVTPTLPNMEGRGPTAPADAGKPGWIDGAGTGAANTARRAGQGAVQMGNQFMFEQTAGRARDRRMSFGEILEDERTVIQGPDGPVKLAPMPSDMIGAFARWVDAKYADLIGTDDAAAAAASFAAGVGKAKEAIATIPKSAIASDFEKTAMVKDAGLGDTLANFGKAALSNPVGALSWMLETAGESAPQMAAALGTTIVTRNPAAGAAVAGVGTYGSERLRSPAEFLEEKGINLNRPEDVQKLLADPTLMREAAERGVIRGGVIAAFDALSMGLAGKALSGNPFVEALAQGFTQAILGSGGEYAGRVAAGQSIDWNEVVAEGFAEMASTPVEMGIAGRTFARNRAKAKDAEARVTMFKELSGSAQSSALRNRMPDRFRQFVESATANGPVENVFVPAKDFVQYFQGIGVDPFALVDDLDGVTRDDLEAALAGAGDDLRIPTATYAAKIAGSDADAFFMENMRFDPQEMTAREAKEFNEKSQDALDEAWEEAEAQRLSEEELRGIDEQVYDKVVSDLRVAGRSTDVATTEAMPIAAFYRTRAERSGLTPEEYLARYPLPKIAGSIPEGMQFKDVDAFSRTLAAVRGRRGAAKDARPSLLEFISEYGGINDPGGELRSRNADTIKRGPGKKTLRLARGRMDEMRSMFGRDDGKRFGLDDVAAAAIEAGYLPDNPIANEYRAAMQQGREVPDITVALLDAIDAELGGERQFSRDDEPSMELRESEMLDQVEEYLRQLGVSADDDDATIRAAIEAQEGRQYAQAAGDPASGRTLLFQGGDATRSDAFKRWFGDSKVVDDQGKPLVVYHGSNAEVDQFRHSKAQDREGRRSARGYGKGKFYFSSEEAIARSYSLMRGADVPIVNPVYLRIEKPMAVAEYERRYREISGGREIFASYEASYDSADRDGYIARLDGEVRAEGFDGLTDDLGQIIVFEPTQIKSVNNAGTFDPADPRILFQDTPRGPRGSIQFPSAGVGNGDTVIRLFENANLSTFTHETGHLFLTMMQSDEARGDASAAAELAIVRDWWRANAADVASDGNRAMADAKITADDVIAALDNGTTGDTIKDAAVDVGMQEQWARAYEAYILDGKAPSVELRGTFEKMRAWLLSVYKSVKALGVNVTPELRGVFDRMLASDLEIDEAQASAGGALPTFATAESMGLTQEEFDRFQKLRLQAEDEAKARLLGEVMAPIKRERDKWFKEEREKVRAETEAKVNAYRYYRAMEWMGNKRWLGEGQPSDMPDIRLSKDIIVQRYGEGVLKTLPRGKQTVYAVEGGVDPDDAAGWFGFKSGDEMVQAMEKAPPRKEAIEAETDLAMRERHGDVLTDGAIEAQALDAVHNDKRGQWIAAELKAVADVAGVDVALTAKEARASARQTVTRMRVRDAVASGRFLAAERKAGQEAARLGAMLARDKVYVDAAQRRIAKAARNVMNDRGELETVNKRITQANRMLETRSSTFEVNEQQRVSPSGKAYTIPGGTRTTTTPGYNDLVVQFIEAKRKQLLNHALYMESRKVADEVEKAERFVAKLGTKAKRERIAGAGRRENASVDYLAAIDELLEQYDFRRMSAKAEGRRGSLNAFVEAMKAAGRENELAIPEAVLANAARAPYKTLPVEEMRGVIDSLKNLEHMALRWDDLIDAQQKRALDEVTADIVAAFDANLPKRPPGRVNTRREALRNAGRQFLDVILNAGTILREIDGFTDAGAAYRNIKGPIDEAMSRLILRKQKAATDLEGLYEVYTKDERRRMSVREHMPELGFSLSKWERIAVALNLGNEGNRQRLSDPKVRGSLTEDQIAAVVATLDKRDADFVQSVWDYIGSFRDDIAARERRATGIEPAWVEASPVTIAGKVLKGGYYPIKYDPRLSSLARDDETQEIATALQAGRFGKAQTKNGHLKDRAQSSGRDVELDMSVMHRHVNQVIYDLELSEPVANSWRILQDGRVRGAFIDAGKQADFDALEVWLKDVAEGEIRSADLVGRTARTLKTNFTAAKLAFNISTVMVQVTGLSQTMVVVGKKDFARGVRAAFRPGVNAEVVAKSPFMSTRETTFNKDIYDMFEDPKTGPVMSRYQEFKTTVVGQLGFWLMTKVQWYLVDVPTWLAGYQQGLRRFGNDEAQAVAHADAIVKRAQASGLFSDRSAIERGSVSRTARQNDVVRLFTTLGSYMFAKFNVAYERSAVAGRVIRSEGASMRSAQEALSWTLDMAFLFTLEAVVLAAFKGQLPDEDDGEEDDGWMKFLAKETAFSVMGTIPGVRDIASPLKGFEGGGAYGGITKELAAPFVQVGQGEVDRSFVKSVIGATGVATGLPTTAINRMVDAKWRAVDGDEVSPLEYLMGRMGK